jgi:arylsulfatase A-like enzyme
MQRSELGSGPWSFDGIAMSVAALIAALLPACGNDAAVKPAAPEQPKAEPSFAAEPAAVPADQPGADQGMRAHLNLLNLAHLADVDQGGLLLDFGTPARMKYTSGQFKTGYGKDGKDGDTTWTNVGATGRVYLPLEGQGPFTLRFRLKPIGTQNMQLFVNGKGLPLVRMSAQGAFAVQDVPLPADVVLPGENQLMMRFGGTSKVEAEDVAVALDYIRVLTGAPQAQAPIGAAEALPLYDTLVREPVVGSVKRKALSLRAPGRLSFYVAVPAQASLSFRVAQEQGSGATARVRVTVEDGEPKQIFEQALKAEWREQVVSLAEFAGQVARIELAADGGGTVAWASPAVVVPEVEVAKAEPAKHVIVLTIDTLRADRLRVYRSDSRVETPALDAFAKEGTLFVNAQSPENWTKPAVASILTGLYPMTHRTKQSESKLSAEATMISELFKKEGFATATFLANGYVSDKFGFAQGWDHYTNYIRENRTTTAENVFKEAGDWIEKNKDKRSFVYIQTIDPHVPYDPPAEFLKKYDAAEYAGQVAPRKTPDLLEKAKRNPPAVTFNDRDRARLEALYDAEISYHDAHFGRFVERLKRLGVYDQSLFVITSDHGEEFFEHGSYGHGHSVYQELLHVPLLFRRPGAVPAGKRIEDTVGTLDIAPTVIAAAGLAVPDVMEGVDRNEHMLGRVPALPAVAFSDFLDDRHAIQAGRFKLILNGVNATFFDLETDPGEKRELDAQAKPIARRYCRILLGQFLGARDLGDWLSAEPARSSAKLGNENTQIDDKTRQGLKALGYAN